MGDLSDISERLSGFSDYDLRVQNDGFDRQVFVGLDVSKISELFRTGTTLNTHLDV